jgi:hypothetical protein
MGTGVANFPFTKALSSRRNMIYGLRGGFASFFYSSMPYLSSSFCFFSSSLRGLIAELIRILSYWARAMSTQCGKRR